jgi:hypothetical protein
MLSLGFSKSPMPRPATFSKGDNMKKQQKAGAFTLVWCAVSFAAFLALSWLIPEKKR